MHFHVMTLFPEMIMEGLSKSIIGRAQQKECISLDAVNIRDYTLDKHKKVDDYPYGGGTDYISIGDYVLTGGELPAMVMIDTISRLVPGVLNNGESAQTESHSDGLLEYPQYSRPEVWHEKTVPDVLLSGHHANIEKWRHEQALLRTQQRRPDMYSAYMEAHPPLPPKRRRRKSANAVNKEENTEIMEIIP